MGSNSSPKIVKRRLSCFVAVHAFYFSPELPSITNYILGKLETKRNSLLRILSKIFQLFKKFQIQIHCFGFGMNYGTWDVGVLSTRPPFSTAEFLYNITLWFSIRWYRVCYSSTVATTLECSAHWRLNLKDMRMNKNKPQS